MLGVRVQEVRRRESSEKQGRDDKRDDGQLGQK